MQPRLHSSEGSWRQTGGWGSGTSWPGRASCRWFCSVLPWGVKLCQSNQRWLIPGTQSWTSPETLCRWSVPRYQTPAFALRSSSPPHLPQTCHRPHYHHGVHRQSAISWVRGAQCSHQNRTHSSLCSSLLLARVFAFRATSWPCL